MGRVRSGFPKFMDTMESVQHWYVFHGIIGLLIVTVYLKTFLERRRKRRKENRGSVLILVGKQVFISILYAGSFHLISGALAVFAQTKDTWFTGRAMMIHIGGVVAHLLGVWLYQPWLIDSASSKPTHVVMISIDESNSNDSSENNKNKKQNNKKKMKFWSVVRLFIGAAFLLISFSCAMGAGALGLKTEDETVSTPMIPWVVLSILVFAHSLWTIVDKLLGGDDDDDDDREEGEGQGKKRQ
eukprot:TRINITY_DN2544_c2_g1_i1.p1 TRINITY_DN2544_c2_g1~~TRINITY_DN2544_c2_g1_i1.p1  ORF type:complete len:242 (+),score=60.29 TRINITY_DN2544_c2_g1_i1:40-765(+)